MEELRQKIKKAIFVCFMSLLLAAGILLGGSEFVGFPWGPLAGAVCLVVFGLIGIRLERRL